MVINIFFLKPYSEMEGHIHLIFQPECNHFQQHLVGHRLMVINLYFFCCIAVAIDNTTDCYVGMEHFLGWDTDDKVWVCIHDLP